MRYEEKTMVLEIVTKKLRCRSSTLSYVGADVVGAVTTKNDHSFFFCSKVVVTLSFSSFVSSRICVLFAAIFFVTRGRFFEFQENNLYRKITKITVIKQA